MPKFEIEIGDNGELVGTAPTELDAIFKRIETTAHGAGFTTGTTKATEEAKAQIEAARIAERARIEALAPLQKDQYERESAENKTLKTQLLEVSRSHGDALKSQEERNAQALLERSGRNQKLSERIVALTKDSLKGHAVRFGARDESLAELEVILHSSIGYDDDMTPYVRNGDGSRRTVQGKDLTIDAFVKEYLDTHTHHRKPTTGGGGGARGGASFHGHKGGDISADAAKARYEGGDRSAGAINDLFEATRQKKAS